MPHPPGTTKPGAIPIADARDIGKKRKCPVVVIFAIEESGERFTTTTWGRDRNFCKLAAGFGEDIANAVFDGVVVPRKTPDGLPGEPTEARYTVRANA